MKTTNLKDIKLRGELGARASILGGRLEGKEYRPESIFSMDGAGWPADWEGRTILAVTLISQLTKKDPVYLEEIIKTLKSKLNEKGYLKEILPLDHFNEQQLSGHSWMLRGLIELYNCTPNEIILKMIKDIVENLFLPTRGFYDKYPIKKEDRAFQGEKAGQVFGKKDNWYLSSDTGCVYIPIDGLSHAYELLGDKRILQLLEEMIENFLKIDFVDIQAQTHATLSATRGILRTYDLTKRQDYLDAVIKIFDLYVNEGMTANFANYNWFGRPQWTEPCAIIDSYIVAMELFRFTKRAEYLDWAQKIWYNGVEHSQRPNGGFGCDNCVGATTDYLEVSAYESFWCCTMRGGEGITKCAQYSYLIDDNESIYIPIPHSSETRLRLKDGSITLRQKTNYPKGGNIELELLDSQYAENILYVNVFMPPWVNEVIVNGEKIKVNDSFIKINILKNKKTLIDFEIPKFKQNAYGNNNVKDKLINFYGNVILGSVNEEENNLELTNEAMYKQPHQIHDEKIKILF